MSQSVEIASALARQLGVSETTAVEVTRRIRAEGLFVRQTRSATSPAPGAKDAAHLLIALMSGHSTRNVAEAVTAAYACDVNGYAQRKYFWANPGKYHLHSPENRRWFVDTDWQATGLIGEDRQAPMRAFTGEVYQTDIGSYALPDVLAALIEIIGAYPEFYHAFGASHVSYDPDRNAAEIEFFHSSHDPDSGEYDIRDGAPHFKFEFEDELNDFKGDLSRSATISFATLQVAARALARTGRFDRTKASVGAK